jgi:hypothetical protein
MEVNRSVYSHVLTAHVLDSKKKKKRKMKEKRNKSLHLVTVSKKQHWQRLAISRR